MISGIQALQQLDQGLGTVRQDIDRIDHELNHVSEKLHANRRQQANILKQMAEVRLDALQRGELIGSLDAADQRAMALLDARKTAYQELEESISAIQTKLTEDEQARTQAHAEVNTCAQAVIDCEQATQAQLDKDDAYQIQLNEARRLDNIALQAEEKAKQAETDRQEKGLAFEQNQLFMYLWKRRYGTPDYNANTLTRALDGWVEKMCHYNDFRVNYWTLLEIPKRLLEHAKSARSVADDAISKLAEIEQALAEQHGLPEKQDELTHAQQKLDAIDDQIANTEDDLNAALLRRTQFAEAKDSYMEQSLNTLHDALEAQSLLRLGNAAQQTRSTQDNHLVNELADLHEQHNDLEDELQDHRRLHEAKLSRLQQLEDVRRRFKNRRFDDLRSGFGNEGLIMAMLGQFLNGLINSGELWRVLERHQRHRDVGAWPDFGSGGLGDVMGDVLGGLGNRAGRRQRSPWHFPTSRGGLRTGGGGFRLPRSGGSSSRGGFRTGGGF